MWLREVRSCSCLPDLPGFAWVLLSKICILFSRSLYVSEIGHSSIFILFNSRQTPCGDANRRRAQETEQDPPISRRLAPHCEILRLRERTTTFALDRFGRGIFPLVRFLSKLGGAGDRFSDYLFVDCANLLCINGQK